MGLGKELDKCDKMASRFVHRLNLWYFEFLVYPFAMMFNPITIWLYPLLSFFYINRFIFNASLILRALFYALYMLIWILGLYVVLNILKKLFERDRPVELNAGRHCSLRRKRWGKYSLPSGDTAQAMLIICFFVWFLGFEKYFYLIIVAVAFARLFYQASWLFDIISGAAVGYGMSWGCWALYAITHDFWDKLVN